LTVSVVVAITTIVGGCIGHVPFNVLQMLWLNLIMDTLGAIALCTEPWIDQDVQRASRTKTLMTTSMWKLVLVQALYQTIVVVVLMFFYGAMAFKPAPNLFTTPLINPNNTPSNRLKMDTFIFHTFILMTLFNQFNCRNIDCENLNPFSNILGHLFFFFIWVIEVGIQQTMVMYGSDKEVSVFAALLGTAKLRWWEHMTAYILALLTMGVFVASKKIPDTAFAWTSVFGLEKKPDPEDRLNKWHGIFSAGLARAQMLARDPNARIQVKTETTTEDPEAAVVPLDENKEEQ